MCGKSNDGRGQSGQKDLFIRSQCLNDFPSYKNWLTIWGRFKLYSANRETFLWLSIFAKFLKRSQLTTKFSISRYWKRTIVKLTQQKTVSTFNTMNLKTYLIRHVIQPISKYQNNIWNIRRNVCSWPIMA